MNEQGQAERDTRLNAIEERAKALGDDYSKWECKQTGRGGIWGYPQAMVIAYPEGGTYGVTDRMDERFAAHIAGLDPDTALWLVNLIREQTAENERLQRREATADGLASDAIAEVERLKGVAGIFIDEIADMQRRAEAAERERDEAQAALNRVKALVDQWMAPLAGSRQRANTGFDFEEIALTEKVQRGCASATRIALGGA